MRPNRDNQKYLESSSDNLQNVHKTLTGNKIE